MAIRALTAVLAVLVSSGSASAQVSRNDLNLALAQLQRSVERLGPRAPRRLVDAAQWLRGRASSTNPAQVSASYLRTLTNAAVLLDNEPGPILIDDIADELETKVEHCRSLGIGMGGTVLLRVNTRQGPQAASNWQVFYLLKIYENASGAAPSPFATLSTPAETRLDPGRYWVWARDPTTGRTSERALLKVVGKQELLLDLPVP
jgi:hypothetical protein